MPQHLRRSRVAVVSALLVLLALVAVPLAAAAAAKRDGHGHHHPTIAEARALPLGTVVTIEGTVTTPSGVFASSFFDEGFAIQRTRRPGSSSASRTPTSACSRRGASG